MSAPVLYPITSVVEPAAQAGSFAAHDVFAPSACATNPFIESPLISAVALVCPWGPPAFLSVGSRNGLSHDPVAGFGEQTGPSADED